MRTFCFSPQDYTEKNIKLNFSHICWNHKPVTKYFTFIYSALLSYWIKDNVVFSMRFSYFYLKLLIGQKQERKVAKMSRLFCKTNNCRFYEITKITKKYFFYMIYLKKESKSCKSFLITINDWGKKNPWCYTIPDAKQIDVKQAD